MRIACCIPKATNTHSEYVIHVASPLQQWLHEHVHCSCTTDTDTSLNSISRLVLIIRNETLDWQVNCSCVLYMIWTDRWTAVVYCTWFGLTGELQLCTVHDLDELQSTNSGSVAFVCRTVCCPAVLHQFAWSHSAFSPTLMQFASSTHYCKVLTHVFPFNLNQSRRCRSTSEWEAGLQRRVGRFGQKTDLLLLPRIDPRFLSRVARSSRRDAVSTTRACPSCTYPTFTPAH